MENLCLPVIWGFEICYKIVESCVPDAIQAFVDFAGPPEEYCYLLFLCPDRPTTPLPLNWLRDDLLFRRNKMKNELAKRCFCLWFSFCFRIIGWIEDDQATVGLWWDCMKVCQGNLAWQLATHRMWVSSSGSTACHPTEELPSNSRISWLQNKTKKRNQTLCFRPHIQMSTPILPP